MPVILSWIAGETVLDFGNFKLLDSVNFDMLSYLALTTLVLGNSLVQQTLETSSNDFDNSF